VFKGTNRVISSVIPGSPVHSVAISMDVNGQFDMMVDDLKKSTCPITEIEYTAPGWDFLEFFAIILEQFPEIQSIKYYSIIPFPQGIRNVSNVISYRCYRH
jgi:hypothetical protein